MTELVTKTDLALALDNVTYRLTTRRGRLHCSGCTAMLPPKQ
jgi:hypothetical protein